MDSVTSVVNGIPTEQRKSYSTLLLGVVTGPAPVACVPLHLREGLAPTKRNLGPMFIWIEFAFICLNTREGIILWQNLYYRHS